MNSFKPLLTPVLLIVYNRPEHTRKVMEAVRQVEPRYLFITADGPKENKPGDAEKCQLTREIATTIDWHCEVKTRFLDGNKGCGEGVSSGISWFFEQVEEGIILEDDCVPDVSFFPYCTALLNHFRNDSRIMHIGGRNNLTEKIISEYSVYYSAYNHIWGWATWRRAWALYDYHMSNLNSLIQTKKLNYYFKNKVIRTYWEQELVELKKNPVDTWDYQWLYSIWYNQGLCVLTYTNLVENIGFGEGATHTKEEMYSEMDHRTIVLPLKIKRSKRINLQADEQYFRSRIKNIPGWFSRLKIKMGKLLQLNHRNS